MPPYLKIVTSVPFLAVMIAQIGCLWAQYTTNTLTPTYLKYVQGVPDNLVRATLHGVPSGCALCMDFDLSIVKGTLPGPG